MVATAWRSSSRFGSVLIVVGSVGKRALSSSSSTALPWAARRALAARTAPGRTGCATGLRGSAGPRAVRSLSGRSALGVRSRAGPLFGLARADLGDALGQWNLEPRLLARGVVEVRHGDARQTFIDVPLDRAQTVFLFRRHERERRSGGLCARRSSDAVNVVIGDDGY